MKRTALALLSAAVVASPATAQTLQGGTANVRPGISTVGPKEGGNEAPMQPDPSYQRTPTAVVPAGGASSESQPNQVGTPAQIRSQVPARAIANETNPR